MLKLFGASKVVAQVQWPNKHDINTIDRSNLFDVVDAFCCFDLYDHSGTFVNAGVIRVGRKTEFGCDR